MEWGARPPRALFFAPSRKTEGAQLLPGPYSIVTRSEAGPEAGVLSNFGFQDESSVGVFTQMAEGGWGLIPISNLFNTTFFAVSLRLNCS